MSDIDVVAKPVSDISKDRDVLLGKLQALYNAAALASLPALDHKKLEQIGNELYNFITDVYTEIGVGEDL